MNDHALRTLEYDAIRERLAEEASSSLGIEKSLAMTPTDNAAAVKRRLSETTEARSMLSIKGSLPLGGVTDIRPRLRQAQIGGSLEPTQLLEVASTIGASRALKAFLAKSDGALFPLLIGYGNRLGVFQSVENEIDNAIGSNAQVLDRASPELARIRSRKRTSEARLREKLNSIISGGLRTYLQDPVIVQRNDRSCVPVKAEHRAAFGGIVHDASASGATLFIEPASVVEFGNDVREMEVKEQQEVYRILLKLTNSIRVVADAIWATVDVLAEVDFIIARARLGNRMNAVAPDLNSNGVTRLMNARHPLIDPDKVVPSDISIGEPNNIIVLITGPNTGGKTVTLKTLGLLTLMAQSGLHVPAARADMHVFGQVFSDIGDEQSIQQSLSTFSSHITNIAGILESAGANSLVLLDEVGAGTDPGEGAALARALLQFLLDRNARVVATSHYGELKTFAYTTPGVQNASVEFDDVSLKPTYRLLQGIPGSSNAIAIAGRLGLPAEVLDTARELLLGGGEDEAGDVIRSLEEAKRSAFGEAEAAQQARREARVLRDKAEQELSHYEQLRHEIRSKALEESRSIIRKAQEKAANLIADMKRRARANEVNAAGEQAREGLRDLDREVTDEIDALLALPRAEEEVVDIPARPLKAGDRVQVPSLGLVGVMIDDAVDNEKVSVQVGGLRVTVPSSSLTLVGGPAPAPKPAPRQLVAASVSAPESGVSERALMEAASVSQQLTLLGHRADEAIVSLAGYLEDARSAGLTRVRIVHGKGSGVLRRVVHEQLKDHAYVESFAQAGAEEGGAGATIVNLKG